MGTLTAAAEVVDLSITDKRQNRLTKYSDAEASADDA